jgi:hypothetical protein
MTPRRNPWWRVLGEGLVIVVSILLAFGIQAWWEGQQDRAEGQRILSALLDEFSENRDILAATAMNHRNQLLQMEALLAAADSDELPSKAALDSIFGRGPGTPHYNPRTGALTATISSGRINILSNPALRNRLAGWDAVSSDLILDEQTHRDFVFGVLVPAFADFGIGGPASNGRPSRSEYREALESRELLAYLRRQVSWVTHILTHFEDVQAAMDEIVADLAREVGTA